MSLGLKAKYENEHLTPALSPFCYRKTRRGGHATSVFLNHATMNQMFSNVNDQQVFVCKNLKLETRRLKLPPCRFRSSILSRCARGKRPPGRPARPRPKSSVASVSASPAAPVN